MSHESAFEKLVGELAAHAIPPEAEAKLAEFKEYLAASEQQLIHLIEGQPPPVGGDICFGLIPYWAAHHLPPPLHFLRAFFPVPGISEAEHAKWEILLQGRGVVAVDGTLVGFGSFEQLDHGWVISAVLYVLSLATDWVPKAAFGNDPRVIRVDAGETIRVAIVGDWGTGSWDDQGEPSPSQIVMQQVEETGADFTIHLGDVYYAGVGDLDWKLDLALTALGASVGMSFDPNEEVDRLVALWSRGSRGSFTLNSNHEMACGARGYFGKALSSSVFAAQHGTSYFAIEAPNWAIVGLDSAYYTHTPGLMEGRLQDPTHAQQIEWVQSLDLGQRTTIALTHHNVLTFDGKRQIPSDLAASSVHDGSSGPTLWSDALEAFGRPPDFWYWGHVHNGIVYNETSPIGEATRARCVGHGATPFGAAYTWEADRRRPLCEATCIDYIADTPLPNPDGHAAWKNRVNNGFALLTLSDSSICEEFYEQGKKDAVWTRTTPIGPAGSR